MLPSILFLLFTLFATAGAYFLAAHRGRRAGLLAAALTFVFFVALAAGLYALLHGEGAL